LDEFKGNIHRFLDFKDQFERSALAVAIRNCLAKTELSVSLDLVGLHHYANERPNTIQSVALVLEDDNECDNHAVRVVGQAQPYSAWSTIGHLSRMHARVARSLLRHSNNLYRVVELPDLNYTYETRIKIMFEVPDDRHTQQLKDCIRDTCGSVCREPNLRVA